MDLWVDTNNFALPPVASLIAPTVNYSWTILQVQSGLYADEVRLGDTAADVSPVPEPAPVTLLALGGMAMLRRRK